MRYEDIHDNGEEPWWETCDAPLDDEWRVMFDSELFWDDAGMDGRDNPDWERNRKGMPCAPGRWARQFSRRVEQERTVGRSQRVLLARQAHSALRRWVRQFSRPFWCETSVSALKGAESRSQVHCSARAVSEQPVAGTCRRAGTGSPSSTPRRRSSATSAWA